jgi:hypothetical protein
MGLAMLTIVGVATLSHRIKEAKNNQSEWIPMLDDKE